MCQFLSILCLATVFSQNCEQYKQDVYSLQSENMRLYHKVVDYEAAEATCRVERNIEVLASKKKF